MKGVIRSFKRMRMSPLERVVDNIRYKEFKEAGKIAKKELSKFDGRELAETVTDKLAQLDHGERKAFFDELAKSPEKLKHMIYDSDEYSRAMDFVEERDLKSDFLALFGGIVLLCGLIRILKRR